MKANTKKTVADAKDSPSEPDTQFYSFQAWQNIDQKDDNSVVYYFDLDESGMPIKLGDGSYGSVYRVRAHRDPMPKGQYAVKIYYPFKDFDKQENRDFDPVRTLFKEELGFMNHIRTVVYNQGINQERVTGVVVPRHGTDCFDRSIAANELFMGTGKMEGQTKFSSYALVMDLYEGTLKDLLETKRHSEDITGYEILRQLAPNERLPLILPFISSIIEGLRALNFGGFSHLDLKPANIFYKREGNQFKMVVGDMGYLKVEEKPGAKQTIIEPVDPTSRRRLLGTRHYRSPEQKDSYDICDAEVWKSQNNKVLVKITDPKFADSVMEADDFIFFSKMTNNIRFCIENIETGANSAGKYWLITIEDGKTKNEKVPVIGHEVTQIVLLKNQKERTDLFGVGALAFDLLTAGSSPEFFYERLRAFDSEDPKTGKNISQIMDMYQKVSSFNSNDPIARHIFSVFSHKDEFPSVDIIRFILKCMLYKSHGTYFHDFIAQKQERYLYFDKLWDNFDKTFPSKDMVWFNNNLIDHKPMTSGTKVEPEQLASILNAIQHMGRNQAVERLLLGYQYLREIFNCIKGQVFMQPKNFFLEYYPANVTKIRQDPNEPVLHNLRCDNTAFETVEQYQEALLGGDIQLKLYTDKDDFFVPNYITHLRKPILLEEMPGTGGNQTETEETVSNATDTSKKYRKWDMVNLRYSFTSRSFAYDKVKVGDWVLAYYNDEPVDLYRIEFTDKQHLKLKHFKSNRKGANTASPATEKAIAPQEETVKFVYFKDIDRLAYYLHLLGMYVHQFFFFEKGDSNSDVLSFVDFVNIQIFRDSENSGTFKIRTDDDKILKEYAPSIAKTKSNTDRTSIEIMNIYIALTRLYARFTFHNMEGTFYHDLTGFGQEADKYNAYRDIFSKIESEFEEVRTRIEKPLGIIRGILDDEELRLPDEFDVSRIVKSEDHKTTCLHAWPDNFHFVTTLEKVVSKPKQWPPW